MFRCSLCLGSANSRTLHITSVARVQTKRKGKKRMKLSTPYPTFTPLTSRMDNFQLSSPVKLSPMKRSSAANVFRFDPKRSVPSVYDKFQKSPEDKSMDEQF